MKTNIWLEVRGDPSVLKTWLHNNERTAIQSEIDTITGEATEYRLYEPLVGGILLSYEEKGDTPSTKIPL